MLWIVIGRPAFRIFWKLAAHDCMPRTRRAMLEIALWADKYGQGSQATVLKSALPHSLQRNFSNFPRGGSAK